MGDITKIIAQDGTIVANYVYDYWGKILSITNSTGATISDTSHIAHLNPFRYRGYVFDDETGLYYLQSRYYDPVIGRFLNADVYCDTGTGTPLSTNMFAYCENNPVMRYDFTGEDASWLQDTNAVASMGHTSLLIQEKKGRWWYFYWGDRSIKLIYVGTCTLESLNKFLNKNKNNGQKYYSGKYEYNLYLEGNFYASLEYIYHTLLNKKGKIKSTFIYYPEEKKNPKYTWYNNNCMQVSIDCLMKGNFKHQDKYYKSALNALRLVPIPNTVSARLRVFHSTVVAANFSAKAFKSALKALMKAI